MPRKCSGNSKRKRSASAKLLVCKRWNNEADGDNRECNVDLLLENGQGLGLNIQTQIIDDPIPRPSCSSPKSDVSNDRPMPMESVNGNSEPTGQINPQQFTRPSSSNINNGITIGLNEANDIDNVGDSRPNISIAETTPKQSATAMKASRMSYSGPMPKPTDNTGSEFILVQ